MVASQQLELSEVFGDYMFVQSFSGRYPVPGGLYPLLGLPGSLDIKQNALLFCKLQAAIEGEVQKRCLNGVIEKMRIHRSARVNGPDTMLVLASDLLHEFAVCQVPKVSDVEELISGILEGRGVIPPDAGRTQIPAEKIEAYLKTKYRFEQGLDAVTLRIDVRSEALSRLYAKLDVTCGVFITAYNPMGQACEIETNDAANEALAADFAALSTRVIEGAGADSSGAWPEEKSFFGLGIDLDAARSMGTRYRQDAIVWIGADAVPKLILLR